MTEEKIVIIDEEGNEIEMEVLFTFDSDETNKQYVLYFDPQEEEGQVFVSSYSAEGELFPIDDQNEWDMINEVFETFISSYDEEDEHDHNHDHDHHHTHPHDHHHEH